MGKFLNIPVINGKALQTRQYVLFRWKKEGEEEGWRVRYLRQGREERGPRHSAYTRELPIPPALYPVPAVMHNFQSLENAGAEMRRHWGSGVAQHLKEEIYYPFFDILYSLLHHREIMKMGFGIQGLYSRESGRMRLESVHALLPFADHTSGDIVPLVAACLKAPWNFQGVNWRNTDENFDVERWGIEFAILVHAARTFFSREEYSLGSQMSANWRMGFLFPIPGNSSSPQVPLKALLEYLNQQDVPELRSDAMIFGIEMGEVPASGLGVFPNLGKEWIAYGFRIDAQSAARVVRTYQHWLDVIFNDQSVV